MNTSKWLAVDGIVKPGHRVASGLAADSPYPQGTIAMQTPCFQILGFDLSSFFPATLNISIYPKTFSLLQSEVTFKDVLWHPDYPAETFSFSPCRLCFRDLNYDVFLYYPHPETKIGHFQDAHTLEILAPFIPNIDYGKQVTLSVNPAQIAVRENVKP